MSTRSKLKVPARLARGRQRFDKFRKTHKGHRRLPESLWSAAVKLARTYGVNRTATSLGLDYGMLKKRLASSVSATPPESASEAGFIELLPTAVTAAECVLECQDAKGTRLRLHFKGPQLPDLAALGRALWNGQS
jgi:hypothetical protein